MKTFRIISLIAFLVLIFPQLVEAQVFEWAKALKGTIVSEAITTDNEGNSYITGWFGGTATLSSTQITSNGDRDIFIAKYDVNGNFQWVQQAGGTSLNCGKAVSLDAANNIYITGFFSGIATFGSTQITSSGAWDIFIAKYDVNGNFQWVQQGGGSSNNDEGNGIATDNGGNSYITGYFFGTATFGSTQIISSGDVDIFIAKYDVNGNFQWVQQAGSAAAGDYGRAISIDDDGNCYVTGHIGGAATFASAQIISSGNDDIFIAKYDVNGNFQWVQQAGGTNQDRSFGISTDLAGNSYIVGTFLGTSTFGLTDIISNGVRDIFIAKYDVNGNFIWVNRAGGASNDEGYSIAIDNAGNCFITGYFIGTATFGSTQITSTGHEDIFIAKYDVNGNFIWVRQAGGEYIPDYGYGISADVEGNCYVTGDSNLENIILDQGRSFITKLITSSLIITSPLGGEVWQTNTVHNITWNCADDGNIKIEITTNNGTNWFTLQNSVQANLGSFSYAVTPFPNSTECRIRLTSLTYETISTSGLFSITSSNVLNLTITSPNTVTKWNTGSSQNITWTKTGSIDNVKLEYTTNNGNNWTSIIASTTAAAESYNWTIPNTPSNRCRVRVSDVNNSVLNDVSDALFAIANITITAPTLGEKWRAQTERKIRWSSGEVADVKIFYSLDDGENWTMLWYSTPANSGSVNWDIPNVASTNCRIKIEDASDNTIYRVSDLFEIWQPVVSTQTPSTGQISQSFGSTNILFTGFVIVSDATITTYYGYESPQSGSLPSGITTVSKYYWQITSTGLSFFNGGLSVPISTLIGITDPSKLVWLKRTNPGDAWTNIGGSVSEGNLLSTVTFDSFSEFAIGSSEGDNPLPVELTSFSAVKYEKKVQINWTTATEINTNGFEVERVILGDSKTQGLDWEVLGFVSGHGNSMSPKNYSFVDERVEKTDKYKYRLKQIDNDGSFTYSNEIEVSFIPTKYELFQNFPNPFNPSTIIRFGIPFDSNVKLVVYNLIGEVVKELVSGTISGGYQEVSFDAGKLSSGIYFYTLQATSLDGKQNYQSVKKMLLIK